MLVFQAAGEISCGNPALPTPSLSLLPSSYPTTVQPGVLPSFAPPHALPFPGLSPGTKLPGQLQACKGADFPGPATGTFQHGLAHGEQILILKITMDLGKHHLRLFKGRVCYLCSNYCTKQLIPELF